MTHEERLRERIKGAHSYEDVLPSIRELEALKRAEWIATQSSGQHRLNAESRAHGVEIRHARARPRGVRPERIPLACRGARPR